MDASGEPRPDTETSASDNLGPELARLAWWTRALRAACTALHRTTAEELPAITVACCPDGMPVKRVLLTALVERIADEHGLWAEISPHGRSFTVRLRRRDGSAPPPGV